MVKYKKFVLILAGIFLVLLVIPKQKAEAHGVIQNCEIKCGDDAVCSPDEDITLIVSTNGDHKFDDAEVRARRVGQTGYYKQIPVNESSSSTTHNFNMGKFEPEHYNAFINDNEESSNYCDNDPEFAVVSSPVGELNFSMEPSSLDGTDTINRLEIYGGEITAGWEYKLKKTGDWDGGDGEIGDHGDSCGSDVIRSGLGTNDWRASSNERIIIENICRNGNACRDNCNDDFKNDDTYKIDVYQMDGKYVGQIILQEGGSDGGPGGKRPEPCGTAGITTAFGCIETTTAGFINTFLQFAMGIAGGIAFIMMAFGAIRILTAAGNPESINSGREIIISALTGLLFIVFSVFLLRLIGIDIFGLPIPP